MLLGTELLHHCVKVYCFKLLQQHGLRENFSSKHESSMKSSKHVTSTFPDNHSPSQIIT